MATKRPSKVKSLTRAPVKYLIWAPVVLIVLVAALFWIYREYSLGMNAEITCADGARRRIDPRQFENDSWAYSAKLQAKVGKGIQAEASVSPVQIKQLSDALYQSAEARKLLVHSFNSCAVSSQSFLDSSKSLQKLDALAATLLLSMNQPKSPDSEMTIAKLVDAYVSAVAGLNEKRN